MTPEQAIKHAILLLAVEQDSFDIDGNELVANITEETINDVYDELRAACRDTENEIRQGEVETGIPSQNYSRHYEVKEVAMKTSHGWVGWSYWFGGGKHGEPEAVDWMDDAYFLNCVEEEKMVVVQTFSRK